MSMYTTENPIPKSIKILVLATTETTAAPSTFSGQQQ